MKKPGLISRAFAFNRCLLSSFQLDHITGDSGGVTGQHPRPESVFLNLGVDHGVTALGLDRRCLRTNEAAVLLNRDHAEQQQAGGRGFAVTNHGVLAAVVLFDVHRGAGATRQNPT